MGQIIVSNHQFVINGQPELIQAGEFHYFRTPVDQWAHRLGLLKGAGFNAVAAYIPWLWHQVAEDVSDFDGHSHPMRDLAGFLDLAAEMGFYIISRPGPYINAETTNEGIPPWVFEHYPQVAFVDQNNKRQNIISYMHPDFRACIQKWYRSVYPVLAPRQITRGGKIILIQLDNEMGMMPWVRNIMDTNPDTMVRFADYLRMTYGAALVERYPLEDLPGFLQAGIRQPQAPYASLIVEDYRRFYRGYLREYTQFLLAEARANGLEVPPVINIHGFANGGKTFPIGISQLLEVMRMDGIISATDVYPGHIDEGNIHQLLLVNEMTKALHHPQQPLFSIEFQAGGGHDFGGRQTSMYDLYTRLCLSSGLRGINHYLFCDGENHPVLSSIKRHNWGHPVRLDGSLRHHYHRYPELSRVLKSYGEDLVLSQPQTVTTIGFQIDDFMTEVNNAFTSEASKVITHQRDTVLFDMLGRGLTLTHRPFDAVEISSADLTGLKDRVLWVMLDKQCDAGTQAKLVEFVRGGGKLVLAGRLPVEQFNHSPCTILKEALGVTEMVSEAPFVTRIISAFDYQDIPVTALETYRGSFDEVFARDENGAAVGFVKRLEQGTVLVFGAAMPADTLGDIDVVNRMAERMGCLALFQTSQWADVRLSKGEKGGFLFVNNYLDDPVETAIDVEGKALFGGNLIHLPARHGLILPLAWRLKPDVIIHNVTSEVIEVAEDETGIQLRTAQEEFTAELSLKGWRCEGAQVLEESDGVQRVLVREIDGVIGLRKGR